MVYWASRLRANLAQFALVDAARRTREQADRDRQEKLENCVNFEADQVYWNYIQLNGKPVQGKLGTYTAAQYQWDHAEKMKTDKEEECRLLYIAQDRPARN